MIVSNYLRLIPFLEISKTISMALRILFCNITPLNYNCFQLCCGVSVKFMIELKENINTNNSYSKKYARYFKDYL